MFHVLSRQDSRQGRVEDALDADFPRLLVVALSLRVGAHAVAALTNVLDPQPNFSARLLMMFTFTLMLLPIALLHRHVPSFRRSAFYVVHVVALLQYPLEAAVWGAQGRDIWLFFLLAHASCVVFFAASERKAIALGVFSLGCVVAGLFLDPAGPKALARQASVVLVGAPLLSLTEYFLARFSRMLWEKDQRIQELASQNENGLRMLSHDMANIMTLARDSLEIGMEEMEETPGKLTGDSARYLDETRFAIVQGIGMLQAVRDYLAIFSGKKDPGIEEFPLADVLRDVVQLWQRPAKKKFVSVALSCRVERHECIVAGSRPLFTHTIIGNLVSNAIKFSPPRGRILVSLRYEEDEDELVIEVSDQGEGISDTRMHSLFDGNMRTSSNGTHGERGTGFGLPLVRATLAMFGGRISVATQGSRYTLPNGEVSTGSGTTFACRIPRRRAAAKPAEATADAVATEDRAG